MRCFISIDIENPDLKNKIAEIQKQVAGDDVNLIPVENLHITLKFLGEISHDRVDKIDDVLQRIDYPNLKLIAAGVGAFPNIENPRTIWIGFKKPEKLATLANIIDRDLNQAGFPKNDKEFAAHLTIARVKNFSPELKERLENMKDLVVGNDHAKYFKLKKSELTSSGPVYSDIKKYLMV